MHPSLRPHVPDRDAGRPEHRPDRLARIVRAHQLVRLHRDAVPQGRRKGKVTEQIDYLTAMEEDDYIVAQANAPLKSDSHFAEERVLARRKGSEVDLFPADEIGYMDVSPRQMVSVATSLIPFLEHDDANRALMGANMAIEPVPLLRNGSPFVGTGMEGFAVDAGDVITADKGGVVAEVSADSVTVQLGEGGTDLLPAQVRPLRTRARRVQQPRRRLRRVSASRPARSSPTVPRPTTASSRSARTCSSRSCRGRVTTSRTRSSSARTS